MVRPFPEGSNSQEAISREAAGRLHEKGNQKLDAILPVASGVVGNEKNDVGQELSIIRPTTKKHEQPIKLIINKHAVDATPDHTKRPPGLPLRFINEQELRHPSGLSLRRVIGSHAKRDVDLKRRHIRSTLKARSPRPLLQKKENEKQLFSSSSRDHAGHTTISVRPSDTATPSGETQNSLTPNLLNIAYLSPQAGSDDSRHRQLQRQLHPSDDCDRTQRAPQSVAKTRRRNSKEIKGRKINVWNRVGSGGATRTTDARHHPSNSFVSAHPLTKAPFLSVTEVEESNDQGQDLPESANSIHTLVRGSWRHDPFDTHRELNSPRISFLLSHYNSIIKTVWVSGKKLISFQTSRPGLLHATIFFTASHLRVLTNSKEYDRDILHHKGETIRIINSGLDDPSEQTSDQMIAALSSLIFYEESYGSKQTASIHRQGLEQILRLRYAKPDLGIHRFVQHLLAHPPTATQTNAEDSFIAEESSTPNFTQSSSTKTRSTSLGHAVTTSFLWLTNTAIQLESAFYNPENDHQIRQDIEEYLELCPYYPRSKMTFAFRSWLLLALIYLHVAIVLPTSVYNLPRNQDEIVEQLKIAMYNSRLGQSRSESISPCSPRLWVLMLSGLYARADDKILLGNPEVLNLGTVSELHWCRAQLLLRDIPWAERRFSLKATEDDWDLGVADRFWRDGMERWSLGYDRPIG